MKLKDKFLLLSRGKQIGAVVFAIHLFAIFASFGHHLAMRQVKPPRAIIVRSAEWKTENGKQKEVVTKPVATAPKVKKEEAKPKVEKKIAAKPKPLAKKAPFVKPDPIFKEGTESLKNLEEEVKFRPPLSIPSKEERKGEKIVKQPDPPSYAEFLISFLQTTLDLPEFGEVKVKMEIDRFGKLIDCEILEAKSRKNGEFLKERLPDLSFPCLADFGILESTHTFTITFRNS